MAMFFDSLLKVRKLLDGRLPYRRGEVARCNRFEMLFDGTILELCQCLHHIDLNRFGQACESSP